MVTIPCSPVQPTLNLAQAVLIVSYELFMARGDTPAGDAWEEPPAAAEEIDGLLGHAADVLTEVGFARDDSFPGVLRDLRRLAARAAPARAGTCESCAASAGGSRERWGRGSRSAVQLLLGRLLPYAVACRM